jgi:alkylhydroperoxidase family enzyme
MWRAPRTYLYRWVVGRTVAAVDTPRIPFDQLPPALHDRLRARVERLGYLGEFFQVGAHQPEALAHFIAFTEALKEALPARLVEVTALTVATETGNRYEQVQHERLALTVGLDEDEVRALVSGESLDGETFSAVERAAADLARDVVAARGRSCEAAYERLADVAGAAVAVGCLMTATRYLAHATMANTWGLRPPVSSPLQEAVDA